jgi:hypothetical protein
MTERPWYVPPRHVPLEEPVPVSLPPRSQPVQIRPSKWDPTLERLRAHPGQWFIICEYSGMGNSPAYLADLAMKRGFSIEMCERVGGPKGDRTSRVYARRVSDGPR